MRAATTRLEPWITPWLLLAAALLLTWAVPSLCHAATLDGKVATSGRVTG